MVTTDILIMQRCLSLARQAWGYTAPNPMVGAVIVKNGEIIGEGFHPKAGEPHAEVFALRQAGENAANATAYVSLEPCNHYGRTPPCTEALIAAKVSKVVIGMIDPDPRVSGNGVKRLREAGIEVIVGVEEAACQQLNEAFIHRVLHKRPFGIFKYAMTLDGKIAASTGHSSWITGTEARRYVHELRGVVDAVLIGGNTVRRDNPLLTTHETGKRNPLRVVLSRSLDLPYPAKLWDTSVAPTLVFTQTGADAQRQELLQTQGVEVVECDVLTPKVVFDQLYHRNLLSVLWECGGTLAAEAIGDRTVQKILAFIAPKIIGGITAPSPVGELGLTRMTQAIAVNSYSWQQIGQDLLLEGYLT